MEVYDYVILGGGVAGLCAAKRLLELNIQPLVIEAGDYPAHKVCGEFLSPSSLPILKQWQIHPIPIHQVQLSTPSQSLKLVFPQPAGSLSHLTLDFQLAHQISQQGALLLTQTKVLDLSPSSCEGECHQLSLSSGEKIKAKHLLIATGRLPHDSLKRAPPRYIGFKSHFSGLELNSTLYMFSFKGAYLGLAPVENARANLACLAKMKDIQQFSSSQQFIKTLLSSHPLLVQLLAPGHSLFDHWMEASVPEFGLKSTPSWPQTYWIGDAAGTIPPASGNGLALAIASGYLAAEFAKRQDASGFKRIWKKRCTFPIHLAKGLHQIFLNPTWGSLTIRLSHCFPFFARQIFERTRDRS
jgi:flavin-dependent dehydrogenase